MIEGFQYGYPDREQTIWCIHRDDDTSGRMLCGRKVGFIPVEQPVQPTTVHRACIEAMYGPRKLPPRKDRIVYGTCPVCGGDAVVEEGRIAGHGEVRVDGDGQPYVSGVACLGVNMAPRGQR
jgi:hypothetical protein